MKFLKSTLVTFVVVLMCLVNAKSSFASSVETLECTNFDYLITIVYQADHSVSVTMSKGDLTDKFRQLVATITIRSTITEHTDSQSEELISGQNFKLLQRYNVETIGSAQGTLPAITPAFLSATNDFGTFANERFFCALRK